MGVYSLNSEYSNQYQNNFIGNSVAPTRDAASGVWSLQGQYNADRSNTWPMIKYRYVRWTVTAVRTAGNLMQSSEFSLFLDGSFVSRSGWTMTGPASVPGEGPANLIDGLLNTKFCSSSTTGPWTFNLDTGSVRSFNGYGWFTANDFIGRDPASWTMETSVDNSIWVLRDTVSGYSATTTRQALAYNTLI